MKTFLIITALLVTVSPASAQMLFSENLTTQIDSTKTIQGMLAPIFEFKTEKEDVLTFKNTANLSILIQKKRIINFINKVELSKYGNKIVVSGGYIHVEYRYLMSPKFEIYPHFESQWAESRGMLYKFSTGLQARHRLISGKKSLLLVNPCLFYEYEKWRYAHADSASITASSRSIKSHLALIHRFQFTSQWELITTVIHQAKLDSYFNKPRWGGAIDLIYKVTSNIGLRGAYRFIYDTNPIVPVPKTYTAVEASLDLSF